MMRRSAVQANDDAHDGDSALDVGVERAAVAFDDLAHGGQAQTVAGRVGLGRARERRAGDGRVLASHGQPSVLRAHGKRDERPAGALGSHASTAFDNRFDSSTDSSVSRRGSSAGTRASQRTSIPAAWAGAKYAAMTAFATKLSA